WSSVIRVNDRAGSASGGFPQYPLPAMNVDKRTGAVYVSWADSRNGNPDIYFTNSTDGGKTWGTNHRINDNTDSSQQYMVDVTVDGVTTPSPVQFNWTIGSSHTLGVAATIPVGSGTRYAWDSWSDGGAITHTIVATADGTFTASFVKQFQATVGQDPAGLSVLVDDVSYTSPASFWWNDSSTHSLGAPSPQYATPARPPTWSTSSPR